MVLGQNQSFDKFPIGGVPIVCHFASPLVTFFLCPIDGVNGIKLKCKQETKYVPLKAADFIVVDDETSAIVANMGFKIMALKIDLLPLHKHKDNVCLHLHGQVLRQPTHSLLDGPRRENGKTKQTAA